MIVWPIIIVQPIFNLYQLIFAKLVVFNIFVIYFVELVKRLKDVHWVIGS